METYFILFLVMILILLFLVAKQPYIKNNKTRESFEEGDTTNQSQSTKNTQDTNQTQSQNTNDPQDQEAECQKRIDKMQQKIEDMQNEQMKNDQMRLKEAALDQKSKANQEEATMRLVDNAVSEAHRKQNLAEEQSRSSLDKYNECQKKYDAVEPQLLTAQQCCQTEKENVTKCTKEKQTCEADKSTIKTQLSNLQTENTKLKDENKKLTENLKQTNANLVNNTVRSQFSNSSSSSLTQAYKQNTGKSYNSDFNNNYNNTNSYNNY